MVKNYVKCLWSEFTLPHGDISIFCIVSVKAACCYFFFLFSLQESVVKFKSQNQREIVYQKGECN